MNKAVFLDRDGTLIEECHFLSDPEKVKLLPGVSDGLRKFREAGFLLVMVSNQSGVARGLMSEGDVEIVNERVELLLDQEGVPLDAVYYCPHYPEGKIPKYAVECSCRKPQPGMALLAAKEQDLDLSRSYMIGDKSSDMEFGKNAAMRGMIMVETGYGKSGGERTFYQSAKDFSEAAEQILQWEQEEGR